MGYIRPTCVVHIYSFDYSFIFTWRFCENGIRSQALYMRGKDIFSPWLFRENSNMGYALNAPSQSPHPALTKSYHPDIQDVSLHY